PPVPLVRRPVLVWVVETEMVYTVVAALLASQGLRRHGGSRLLAADFWTWLLVLAVALVIGLVGPALVLSPASSSPAVRYALLLLLALPLAVEIPHLRWIHDAVVHRVLTFHSLLVVAAVIVFGGSHLASGLGMSSTPTWLMVFGLLAVAGLTLPKRADRWLEGLLFPRAGSMRARLTRIAAGPLAAATRAEAGAELLRRVVEIVNSEGGMIVIEATPAEPATLERRGQVEPLALGANAADAARYLRSLVLDGAPLDIDCMPRGQQMTFLRSGVVLVCPLIGARHEATLLLGPRRGWLYDAATISALRIFGHQAALALENLALVNARLAAERALAHGEKLAALGEAAARIAHEIRNPLSAARSLVQQTGTAGGGDPGVDLALGELDRMGRLVNDLLSFARRDEAPRREAVDLAAVCRQAVGQVSGLAGSTEVAIEQDLSCAVVAGDRDRLVQAVSNLCRNAIEALAEARPPRRLTVRCSNHGAQGTVEVRDNGPGIAPDDLPWLFEPFRTSKGSGTGLGLSIARRIVEAHGGRVTVESRPGTETIFRVELQAQAPG
ncbi:MAG TPA: HAMP domain-containing sensor histidine kinase, partial [Candidatus Bathyarchaeia archaeon]|nr:HAMP domain-containing sensor histidine kinase [Candidatus Bathyarchaeia archaeon]